MLKLIVGTKGSGKTKTMIDMIDKAVKTTSGNIVVIEKCMKLTTEINHSARLVDVDEYGIVGADMLYGFVAGMLAGNYDITHVFVDNFTKMLSEVSEPQIAEFLAWLNDFSEREHIQFTLSLSMDPATTGSEITKYMI